MGGYLADALIESGRRVAVLARPGGGYIPRQPDRVRVVVGHPEDSRKLDELFDGCDGAAFLIGILKETRRHGHTFQRLQYESAVAAVNAAGRQGIRRFLLMSALGAQPDGTPYQDTKYRAERAALDSGLAATVFRPSVLFGDPRGRSEIASQIRDDVLSLPVPALDFFNARGPARGPVRLSPAHVRDVADAMVAALDDPAAAGKTYELGGPESLSWGTMVERVAAALGRKKLRVPMPIEVVRVAAALFDWIPAFPANRDQLTMLGENHTASPGPLEALIGRRARRFDGDALGYLRQG